MPLTKVTPTAFTLFDGVQTVSGTMPLAFQDFRFATNANGEITFWAVGAEPDVQFRQPRGAEPEHRHAGRGVYPIIDDADPYGVGSSGPAVPAGSGLTASGLAEVASWRSAT
jgi:hypothetical protein